MAIYAQFFVERDSKWCKQSMSLTAVLPRYLQEATGDRGVIVIDGRLSPENRTAVAAENCTARKYAAYRLMAGNSLLDCQPLSAITRV